MRLHIRILGVIYTGIAVFLGLATLLFIAFALFGKNAPPGSLEVIGIFVALTLWFLHTGLGLLKLRPGSRLMALIVGLVFMLFLNGALLFADGGNFAASTGQKIFHLSCVAVGIYTAGVLLFPGAGAAFQK
ncbi:MAG TPA: hypothetical protein VK400_11330 [Pyrinomonadaceae bacterium]|nr:hypothetical protein [Pyrinomonadaceae bacterium]